MGDDVASDLVRVFDASGELLWEGAQRSGAPSLGAGDTVWVGGDDDRMWGRILTITYGWDTATCRTITEVVLEAAEAGATKSAKAPTQKTERIDHGNHKCKSAGSSISLSKGEILVTVGETYSDSVERLSVRIDGNAGPTFKSGKDLEAGDYLTVENECRLVVVAISEVDDNEEFSVVQVTEYVKHHD